MQAYNNSIEYMNSPYVGNNMYILNMFTIYAMSTLLFILYSLPL